MERIESHLREFLRRSGLDPNIIVADKPDETTAERVLREWRRENELPRQSFWIRVMEVGNDRPDETTLKRIASGWIPSPEARKARVEAIAKEGFTFVCQVEPKSVGQLLTERKPFERVNDSEELRRILPKVREVAVRPENLSIPINNLSLEEQLDLITGLRRELRIKTGIEDLHVVMASASVYSQLDFKCQEQTGRKLFRDFYARTPDETFGSRVAQVGRIYDGSQLYVIDGFCDRGNDYVLAVPVVVLA